MRLLAGSASTAVGLIVICAVASAASLRTLDSIKVSNTAGPVRSSLELQASHRYRLTVSGTVSDWCTTSSCPAGDPDKTAQPNVGVDGVWCYAKWRCPTPEAWQQLLVNGQGILDFTHQTAAQVPYSAGHRYTFELTGVSGRLTLAASDALGSAGDNSGSFSVTITDLGGSGGGGSSAGSTGGVSAGPQTAALQLLLAQLGFYRGSVDGRAGPLTTDALKRAQLELGLPADGRCDDTCETKLKQALASREPTVDPAIRDLQTSLHDLGYYNGPVDGRDTALLQAALKSFQRQADIPADGQCDDTCRQKVDEATGTGAAPAARSTIDLQEGLKRLGLYTGPVDGNDSAELTGALKRFQLDAGVPADGKCDDACQAKLAKALALDDPVLAPGASPVTPKTVTELQTDLKKLGVYTGPVDGKAGTSTTDAIKTFQHGAGLPADGRCGLACQLAVVKALQH